MTPRIPPRSRLSLAYFAWAVCALQLSISWAFISAPFTTRLVTTTAGAMVRRPPHAEPQEHVPGVGAVSSSSAASGGGSRSELELWRDLRCDVTPQQRNSWLLSEAKPGDTVLLPLVAERSADETQAVAAAHSRGVVVLVVDEGGGRLLQASSAGGSTDTTVGAYRVVDTSSSSLGAVLSLVGCVEWVLMDCIGDWTMIPLENVVAAAHNSGTKIAVLIKDAAQVHGAAFALDLGVQALALPHHHTQAWAQATQAQAERRERAATDNTPTQDKSVPGVGGGVGLVEGVITGISSGGVGHRVCLDLIQTLQAGEGALVGSSAKALCLVQAEVMSSPFVPPRPFRVNAGPVHSYVLMADGSTKYLSEVQAGDQVLVVDSGVVLPGGGYACRGVGVGRCKVESRPTLLLSYTYPSATTGGEASAQVFLQQAETVRVLSRAGPEGSVPVTQLKVGDSVLLRLQSMGTHIGRPIAATVTEK